MMDVIKLSTIIKLSALRIFYDWIVYSFFSCAAGYDGRILISVDTVSLRSLCTHSGGKFMPVL
jgi:hypothetical protein